MHVTYSSTVSYGEPDGYSSYGIMLPTNECSFEIKWPHFQPSFLSHIWVCYSKRQRSQPNYLEPRFLSNVMKVSCNENETVADADV